MKAETGREYPVIREPRREPTHPGELLAELLEDQGVSIMAAADALDVSRQTVHRLLAKQMGVTPEMAVRLGKFMGNGPGLWLRMQAAFDLWHAERDQASTVNVVPIDQARKIRSGEKAKAVPLARITAKRASRRPKARARA